ncbi:MAG: FAD/FMN-containing dehydrogenase/Fe-S oxidoreductase [Rhodothermales bacterium]|jgi:FAD/FMN-containing dehydrogenase/Fe-S oxidoreductase
MSDFLIELCEALGDRALADSASRGMYATDASIYEIMPRAALTPKDADDVRQAVAIARRHGVPILPRGGDTSLAGQTVGDALVIDFSKHMNQILEINAEEGWARVQPGVVRDNLNAELAPLGLHFAPDPATSSRANVGGMIGNNSSGTKSILFGKTVDHVIATQFLLADGTELELAALPLAEFATRSGREGEILNGVRDLVETHREEIDARFPKVMRRVGGYNFDELTYTDEWNLAKLVCGSEGTLGLMLEATIRLTGLPKYQLVCVAHFAELLEAVSAVEGILAFGPSAVEILDETVLGLSRQNLDTAQSCGFIEGDPAAILICEFYGDSAEDVRGRAEAMVADLQAKAAGYAYPIFDDAPNQADVWKVRKNGLGLMLGMKGDAKPLAFIEDAAIPVEVLPEYIDRVAAVCKKYETPVAMYAHASVGVIHVRPILDLRQGRDVERLQAIAEETFELVMEYGGSWSGEHGDGLVRSPFNERFFGPTLYQAFRDLKRLFDPDGLMNPGKIVDAAPMTQNLRYGADYAENEPATQFQYRADGGFSAAVHMCTGVGQCRKTLGGTMCPSYMATRDEAHSTRGRANALRLAMAGQLDDDLTGDEVHEALDLCLSCKACKSECPSNVDMAKLKSEVLHLRHKRQGASLRDRLIADSAQAAKRCCGPLAPVVNALLGSKLGRQAFEAVAGFHHERTTPEFASRCFADEFAGIVQPPSDRKVALFADTYTNYHEPHLGHAAVKLLNDCGYDVLLADVGCCQRPRLSHGFLTEAGTDGLRTSRWLDDFLREGIPVLAIEPSCCSALTDDLPDLIKDGGLAGRMRDGIMMIDIFLAAEREAGRLPGRFRPRGRDVLIHGHCHQKSLYGTSAMKTLMADDADALVMEVDSGCCGMAGSFGYEREHYELSREIGERRLFPAVRQREDATVVACGFSCRHQIAHFTDRKALHWIESLRYEAP